MGPFKDIGVEKTGHVALIEIRRPPNNFFDIALIQEIAGALEALDEDADCRAVVLAAQGKAFCAGANFGDGSTLDKDGQRGDRTAISRCSIFISRATGCSAPRSRSSRRCTAPRSAAGWVSRWWRISASPARRRALPPISPGSAFIPASG